MWKCSQKNKVSCGKQRPRLDNKISYICNPVGMNKIYNLVVGSAEFYATVLYNGRLEGILEIVCSVSRSYSAGNLSNLPMCLIKSLY